MSHSGNLKSKIVLILSLFFFINISQAFAQQIQWNKELSVKNESHFLKQDSTEQNLRLFSSRDFLLDSLKMLSPENPYQEKVYTLEFANPQTVNQVIIPLRNVSRLMFYAKLIDTDNKEHLIYEYGATPLCDSNQQVFLLNLPPTLYQAKALEIGIFVDNNYVTKAGIANATNGNEIIRELLMHDYQNICLQTAYLSDRQILNSGINTEYEEAKPIISPDGKTLIFARQNYPGNEGRKRDAQDIYIAQNKEQQWQEARNIGKPLNNKNSNGAAAITPDGNHLLLISEYISEKESAAGVSLSKKTLEGWGFPEKVAIEDFYNYSDYVDYYLSNSQKEMILAVEREDSQGDQDLYVSFFDEASGKWSAPKNMGSTLNTFLGEASPFLAADGVTLYFASEGHMGYGGFDLYYSRRLDDSWTKWSTPENLGPVINTWNDDFYYTIPASGDFAYFTSTENGSKDIYRIGLPKQFRPEPVMLFSGKIYAFQDLEATEADIEFTDALTGKFAGKASTDPESGEFKMVLPLNRAYYYTIYRNNQKLQTYRIATLDRKEYTEVERYHLTDISQQKTKLPGTPENLGRVAEMMQNIRGLELTIKGQSVDSVNNKAPSQLFESLKAKGIAEERLGYIENADTPLELLFSYQAQDTVVSKFDEQQLARVREMEEKRQAELKNVVLLSGKVFDSNTIRPLSAEVNYESPGKYGKSGFASSDPSTGDFQLVLPAGRKYTLKVIRQGYKPYKTEIDLREVDEFREMEHNLILQSKNEQTGSVKLTLGHYNHQNLTEKQSKKAIRELYRRDNRKMMLAFTSAENAMPDALQADLDHLAMFMQLYPESSVHLLGHSYKRNSELQTQLRAQAAADYLKTKGIADKRISFEGMGNEQKAESCLFKRGRNLRIEAIVTFGNTLTKE